MKKVAVALAVGIISTASHAASTASSDALARIVVPIAITKTQDLSFGTIAAGTTAGSVAVDATGTRTASGGATLMATDSGSAATFSVTGEPNATYTITLPSAAITLSSGANTMTADTFVSNPNGTGALDGTGAQTLNVGATLSVGANQAAGDYVGSFDVTVDYN